MPAKTAVEAMPADTTLTPRQREILERVVEEYVSTRQPVGSKNLVRRAAMRISSSTARAELAELEARGLLTHPHTSAGRVPTERGYRLYVDALLDRLEPRPPAFPLNLAAVRDEVESALQATTEMLSELTRLFALVSAPPFESTTVRHVEVLMLQPQVLMVVVITSTGGVSKRVFTFDAPIDPGLAQWAGEFLDERLTGVGLGARMLHSRLNDPSLSVTELMFLERLTPVFTELAETAQDTLYVDGAARLIGEQRVQDLAQINELMQMLERRATLLGLLRAALQEPDVLVRIGSENATPALRRMSVVGAAYGLPARKLGTVSVIGPVRMDYARAIRSVREAAYELSRFIEDVYGP
jgi:heat-inducible transcriptional repressor